MSKLRIHEIAEAILDFEHLYNDKIASLFRPVRGGGLSLTKSQSKVLFTLSHCEDQTATELGEGMNMTKASLTGILDALEAAGLARRTGDSSDRRRFRVSLTSAGRKLCDRCSHEIDAALEERFALLSEAERADFARHLASASALLKKLED